MALWKALTITDNFCAEAGRVEGEIEHALKADNFSCEAEREEMERRLRQIKAAWKAFQDAAG
ncbi:MAG: hypothetical protein OEQ39_04525 [Gammaproteobacteria bacterium]|nr:hypothetical protein [Gammaproteobacteria bacterium]